MSLNFNGPSFVPMIQESQAMKNNGGGGNTGYFQRGRKKKENKDIEVFKESDEQDEFVPTEPISEAQKEEEKKEGILEKFVAKTKGFIKTNPQASKNTPISSNPFLQM